MQRDGPITYDEVLARQLRGNQSRSRIRSNIYRKYRTDFRESVYSKYPTPNRSLTSIQNKWQTLSNESNYDAADRQRTGQGVDNVIGGQLTHHRRK
jgi:hypothetical protein